MTNVSAIFGAITAAATETPIIPSTVIAILVWLIWIE